MPLTAQEAIAIISSKINEQGKFNAGNVLDAVIGVAVANTAELQELLNKLLTKKLTVEDEANLAEILKKQEEEKKKRRWIRTKTTILVIAGISLVGTIIYLQVKKQK